MSKLEPYNVFAEDENYRPPTVEELLNAVSYEIDPNYVPSDFALEFVNFIKLVDGGESENKTPVVHYQMIDKWIVNNGLDTINLCHRGLAKSTLLEYLILYLAVFEEMPGLGTVPYGLYVSDSIDNGVKKMRKSLEYRWSNSEFLQTFVPTIKFTDIRWEFINKRGTSLVISGYGAKALSLDTLVHTDMGTKTIAEVEVGDMVFGSDGVLTKVIGKSEIFNKPMYRILLKDGRFLDVCEDHLNSVVVKNHSGKHKEVLTTKELLQKPLQLVRKKTSQKGVQYVSKEDLIFIECASPIQYTNKNLPIDPYTLGVILGDGRIRKDCGSVELTGHINDFPYYLKNIPYEFGKFQIDKRNPNVRTQSIRGLGKILKELGLNVHGNDKFIPEQYLQGSVEQRLALLQGLMDTDGTVSSRKINSVASFTTNSKKLALSVRQLVYSLGGWVWEGKHSSGAVRLQIHLNLPLFRLERKAKLHKNNSSKLVAIRSIERIEDQPSQCIAVDNSLHEFVVNDFIRTHNTGVRGTRENGSRPVLALLDDLISDEDARSPTVIASVEDTVTKAIEFALHPRRRKVIWNGTPFNQKDPLYKAVESGAYNVNIFPVCEKFPCTREEFRGSWPDRFDYDYVLSAYEKAAKTGKLASFYQELMLRIMSDEERLVRDSDIRYYRRKNLLDNKEAFNFYITTDFATSEKRSADFSAIAVWAINSNDDWFWVDGICRKQTMDKNIDDLFRLVQMWRPQSVGVEVSGQQKGFVSWIQSEMMNRNIYFTLASDTVSGEPGLRPATAKMERFNTIQPRFALGKIYFPAEMTSHEWIVEFFNEIRLVTAGGIKAKHDDCIDTLTMLGMMKTWKPSEGLGISEAEDGMWDIEDHYSDSNSRLSSYIV